MKLSGASHTVRGLCASGKDYLVATDLFFVYD
jgi:hypothetical protein